MECDGCGVTVHEACYGVSDTASIVSTESDCPTEPWFCEACRAGVINPVCELCPNSGRYLLSTHVCVTFSQYNNSLITLRLYLRWNIQGN